MQTACAKRLLHLYNKKAVLSQGEPCDVAVNIDAYRILMKYTAKGINASNMLVKLKQSRYSHVTRK